MTMFPAGVWAVQAVAAETADTFCPADTTDTDVKDCDGVNDGDTDPSADTDVGGDTALTTTATTEGPTTAGDAVGEAGGPSCAAVGGSAGLLAPLWVALMLRRRGR